MKKALGLIETIGLVTAIEAAENTLIDMVGMPVVNMWWAQTPKLMKPVASIASTTSG